MQYFNRSPKSFAVAMRVFLRTNIAKLRRRDLMTNGASFIGQILKVLIDLNGRAARLDECGDGRPHRRRRPRRRRARHSQTAPRSTSRRARASCSRRVASVATLICAVATAATSPMRHMVDRQRGRHRRSAADGDGPGREDRPTGRGLVAPNGFHCRPSAPRRSARSDSDQAPSTSTGPASGSATSRTPTSRSARRCTPPRPCRAGRSSTRVMSADMSPAQTRSRSARIPEAVIEQGAVKRADTIGDLARQIDVPADALEETVKRFNEFAAKGLDPDFGRGQSAYNICLGDPGIQAQRRARPARSCAVLRHPGCFPPMLERAGE